MEDIEFQARKSGPNSVMNSEILKIVWAMPSSCTLLRSVFCSACVVSLKKGRGEALNYKERNIYVSEN